MRSTDVSNLLSVDFLKLSEVFPGSTSETRTKEIKAWLVAKGVRDFEVVPLTCDKVGKVRWLNLTPVQAFNIWGRKLSRESRN